MHFCLRIFKGILDWFTVQNGMAQISMKLYYNKGINLSKDLKLLHCTLLWHNINVAKDLTSSIKVSIPQRNVRSSNKHLLVVSPSFTCTCGDRAFASAAPILWNKLPDKLRAETDTSSFMKSLKNTCIPFFHYSCKKVFVKCIENLLDYHALCKCINHYYYHSFQRGSLLRLVLLK